MRVDSLTMELSLGGAPAELVRCRLHEQVSQGIEGEVEVATTTALAVGGLLQATAGLRVLGDGATLRSWSLIVGSAAFDRVEEGSLRYRLQLFSPLWLLSHTLSTRKFRNMSAQDIVTAVLSEMGVAHRWRLTRVPPVRKYCMQYRESHLAFVRRLLESEGIYYAVDSSGTVVMEDRSAGAASIEGDSTLPLIPNASSLDDGQLGILSFGRGARVGSGRVTVNDYNWKTPRVNLLQSAAAGRDTELELYDYPAGYRKPDQGAYIAQVRLEAARARTSFAAGEANVPTLAAGRTFSVEGGGRYFLASVRHEMFDPRFGKPSSPDDETGYRCHFEAVDTGTPFRPQPTTPRPVVQGCHTAMVRGPAAEEIHTDKHGRFKAQFHWDREATGSDADSRWLRKLQESATSMNLARVGWEVSVAYIDGDPDRPIGLARNINGVMRPAYPQPADKQLMTIKTPTYPGGDGFNEIKLDDRAGAMRFDIRAERDLKNEVQHDKSLKIGRDHARLVFEQLGRQIGRHQHIDIKRDQTLAVDGDNSVQVAGNRDEHIHGSQRVEVAGDATTTVAGNDQEHVGSLRLSIVGQVGLPDIAANAKKMIPKRGDLTQAAVKGAWKGRKGGWAGARAGAVAGVRSKFPASGKAAASKITEGLTDGNLRAFAQGKISRSAMKRLCRTVGAVQLIASAEGISTTGKYALAETIGGVKITAVKGGIAQDGGKLMALTVGGLVCRKSAADIGYMSNKVKVTVGAVAALDAGKTLTINGTCVTLEAATKLNFSTGDTKLLLGPSKAELVGSMHMEAGEKIEFKGTKKENLTKA